MGASAQPIGMMAGVADVEDGGVGAAAFGARLGAADVGAWFGAAEESGVGAVAGAVVAILGMKSPSRGLGSRSSTWRQVRCFPPQVGFPSGTHSHFGSRRLQFGFVCPHSPQLKHCPFLKNTARTAFPSGYFSSFQTSRQSSKP